MSILEEEYRYSDIVAVYEIYLKKKVMKISIQKQKILNRNIDIYAKALYILVIC